jgi:hypothetical protein
MLLLFPNKRLNGGIWRVVQHALRQKGLQKTQCRHQGAEPYTVFSAIV